MAVHDWQFLPPEDVADVCDGDYSVTADRASTYIVQGHLIYDPTRGDPR